MRIYLLSIEELQEEEESDSGADTQALYEKCLRKMDTHRLEKVHRLRDGNARNLAIGAGLLLQHVWADCVDAERVDAQDDRMWNTDEKGQALKLSDLLRCLDEERFPVEIPYRYGDKGKPDFAEGDFHFSLSHSDTYVCCAVDKNQIGIDIQKMRPLNNIKVAERFFTIREQEALKTCDEKQLQERLFYDIWVKKEAYAKLTGEGLGTGVKVNTMENIGTQGQKILWQEIPAPEGYCMATCRLDG